MTQILTREITESSCGAPAVARAIQLSACGAVANPCDTRGLLPAPQTTQQMQARPATQRPGAARPNSSGAKHFFSSTEERASGAGGAGRASRRVACQAHRGCRSRALSLQAPLGARQGTSAYGSGAGLLGEPTGTQGFSVLGG